MQPPKVDVLFVQFAYGGNGGVPMVLPSHSVWFSKVSKEVSKDERIGRASITTLSDTPIPMTRNRAVQSAREGGFDMLFMLDSDNVPDSELRDDASAEPFWRSSFDFAYERLARGLPSLVCAPYCGPPPHENVYVFYWEIEENSPHGAFKVVPYTRDSTSYMTGIKPIAAGPTGVTLYTTNMFDLMEPPYFYYEYKDTFQTEKASTEDVTNFRDLSLNGYAKYDEPVVFCNWDAWAGHTKVKEVTRPRAFVASDLNERFRAALHRNYDRSDKLVDIDFTDKLPKPEAESTPEVQKWEETYHGQTDDSNTSGVAIRKRVLFEQPVTTIGHQTSLEDLEALRDVTRAIAQQNRLSALRVVEVGSWVGESALAITEGFLPDVRGTVFCVDDFSGGDNPDPIKQAVDFMGSDAIRTHFQKNCGDKLNQEIKLLEGSSADIAKQLDPQEAHMVFIDAGHSYDDAMADIKAWLPHVATDGFLCGHDYCDPWPGVMQAVDEVFGEVGATIRIMNDTSIWLVSKQEYLACLDKKTKV